MQRDEELGDEVIRVDEANSLRSTTWCHETIPYHRPTYRRYMYQILVDVLYEASLIALSLPASRLHTLLDERHVFVGLTADPETVLSARRHRKDCASPCHALSEYNGCKGAEWAGM